MAIKKYNPITPTLRKRSVSAFDEITTDKPFKKLTGGNTKRSSGRGHGGKISMRRRGGGHKRLYRIIDFKRNKFDVPGTVTTIEYDPNRSANIALVKYSDGEYRYILAPKGLKVGTVILSGRNIKAEVGNAMPLDDMPIGVFVHNVEMKPGKGGQLARSAGTFAMLVAKEGKLCTLKLPSKEVRYVHKDCMATVGQIGNGDHSNIEIGKAGRSRWLGRRPKVRGVVMNPVDHPMGGGEGKTSGGRNPTTPWGKPTKGYKTVKKPNKMIIRRRGAK